VFVARVELAQGVQERAQFIAIQTLAGAHDELQIFNLAPEPERADRYVGQEFFKGRNLGTVGGIPFRQGLGSDPLTALLGSDFVGWVACSL
jgi:hypothetical protein